jgi:hypothetical protein
MTVPDYGYGTYLFQADCEGYDHLEVQLAVNTTTSLVTLEVNRTPVTLSILDCDSHDLVAVTQEIEITSTFSNYSTLLSLNGSHSIMWVPPAVGSYDFALSAIGYVSTGESATIEYNTTSLSFCLTRSTFVVTVRDVVSQSPVPSSCTVNWTPPGGVSATTTTPPNPFVVTVPDNGYGDWSFQTSCTGFVTVAVTLPISETSDQVDLFVQAD